MTVRSALMGAIVRAYNDALTYNSKSPISDYTSAGDIDFAYTELPSTILDDQDGFVTAGFVKGDYIKVSGSVSNDGYYLVTTVAAGVLTLDHLHVLTPESGATGTITISTPTQGVVLGLEEDSETHSQISNKAGTTKIQTEESLAENIIRFDTAGNQRMTIDETGIVNIVGALNSASLNVVYIEV